MLSNYEIFEIQGFSFVLRFIESEKTKDDNFAKDAMPLMRKLRKSIEVRLFTDGRCFLFYRGRMMRVNDTKDDFPVNARMVRDMLNGKFGDNSFELREDTDDSPLIFPALYASEEFLIEYKLTR